MNETRREKAAADARFEVEAEYRERRNAERAEQLLERLLEDDCPCDQVRSLHFACRDAGMCVGKEDK